MRYSVSNCTECKKEFKHRPSRNPVYCSKSCMATGYRVRMKGSENPHYSNASRRVCEQCEVEFSSYQRNRRFCSLECRNISDFACRGRARKDKNHDKIVSALQEVGATVIDTSEISQGFPDIIVGIFGRTYLMEIKNPENHQSKLSSRQILFHSNWRGKKIAVVRNETEALIEIGLVV